MLSSAEYRRLQPQLYRQSHVFCDRCKAVYLGMRSTCGQCGSDVVTPSLYCSVGTCLALTQLEKPPAEHGQFGSYSLALVEFENGMRMLAQVADDQVEPLSSGDSVTIVFRRLYEPEATGLICYGYKVRLVNRVH